MGTLVRWDDTQSSYRVMPIHQCIRHRLSRNSITLTYKLVLPSSPNISSLKGKKSNILNQKFLNCFQNPPQLYTFIGHSDCGVQNLWMCCTVLLILWGHWVYSMWRPFWRCQNICIMQDDEGIVVQVGLFFFFLKRLSEPIGIWGAA